MSIFTTDDLRRIQSNINELGGLGETEVRFSHLLNGNIINGVTKSSWNRLRRYLLAAGYSYNREVSTVTGYSRGIRQIAITPVGNKPEEIIWQSKTPFSDELDKSDYILKVAFSKETKTNPPRNLRPEYTRNRQRLSFYVENFLRVDLTQIMSNDQSNACNIFYEVELEYVYQRYLDNRIVEYQATDARMQTFATKVNEVWLQLNNSRLVYSYREVNSLNNRIAAVLKEDQPTSVEARNLKARDVVSGGLFNNPRTSYVVAIKADGKRKWLIIYNGVWLISPNREYNLLTRDVRFLGWSGQLYIFDGEFLLSKQNQELFLIFDCLAANDLPYTHRGWKVRQSQIDTFARTWAKNFPIVVVRDKPSEEFTTEAELYQKVNKLLDSIPYLDYQEDGLIFTPTNDKLIGEAPTNVYNPQNERYPLTERVLTVLDDVCKWKPPNRLTIDFEIRWTQTGLLRLYNRGKDTQGRNVDVEFTGSLDYPLTPDMIDVANPELRDVPSCAIMEFEYDPIVKLLKPVKLREDKLNGNRPEVAQDVWTDIHQPILTSDIRGITQGIAIQNAALTQVPNIQPSLQPDLSQYQAMTGFFNQVKRWLIGQYNEPTDRILDIGFGKGGDIHKYSDLFGFSQRNPRARPTNGSVIGIEPNLKNLTQAEQRLADKAKAFPGITKQIQLHNLAGEDYAGVLRVVPRHSIDSVNLMLSLSFFWSTPETLQGLIKTMVNVLKVRGKIVFLTIDGAKVSEMLLQRGSGPFVVGPAIIRAKGKGIEITLPAGSIVETQTEWLVDIPELSLHLSTYGYELKSYKSVLDHPNFASYGFNADMRDYCSLFSYGYFQQDPQRIDAQLYSDLTARLLNEVSDTALTRANPVNQIPLVSSSPRPIIKPIQTIHPVTTNPVVRPIIRPLIRPVNPVNITNQPSTQSVTRPVILPVVRPMITQPNVSQPTQSTQSIQPTQITQIVQPGRRNDPFLPTLSVIIQGNIAIGMDKYQPLKCSWYQNLVRIATIGDGNCLIHSILNAYYPPYQTQANPQIRTNLANNFRISSAAKLAQEDPLHPGFVYWTTLGNMTYARNMLQQLINYIDVKAQLNEFDANPKHNVINPADREARNDILAQSLISFDFPDQSLAGLQKLLNSTNYLGNESWPIISEFLNLDLFIVEATAKDLYPLNNTGKIDEPRPAVVVIGNGVHYELCALQTNTGLQTVFYPEDDLYQVLSELARPTITEEIDYDTEFVRLVVSGLRGTGISVDYLDGVIRSLFSRPEYPLQDPFTQLWLQNYAQIKTQEIK